MRFLCRRNRRGTPGRRNSPVWIDCPDRLPGKQRHRSKPTLIGLSLSSNAAGLPTAYPGGGTPRNQHQAIADCPARKACIMCCATYRRCATRAGHTEAALAPPQSGLGPLKQVFSHMNQLHGRHRHQCDRPRRGSVAIQCRSAVQRSRWTNTEADSPDHGLSPSRESQTLCVVCTTDALQGVPATHGVALRATVRCRGNRDCKRSSSWISRTEATGVDATRPCRDFDAPYDADEKRSADPEGGTRGKHTQPMSHDPAWKAKTTCGMTYRPMRSRCASHTRRCLSHHRKVHRGV